MKSISALLVSLIFLVGPVAAGNTLDWNIVDMDGTVSLSEVSNNTSTVQTVRLVTDSGGEPVKPVNFTSKEDFEFNYSGDIASMQYLQNGYWYADFKPNTVNNTVEYQLVRSDGSETKEENITDQIDAGNITVELMTEINGYVKPGEEIFIEANATDMWNDQNEDNARIDAYVTNGSWSDHLGRLGYVSSSKTYSLKLEMPEKANTSYVLHINASVSSASYENAYGSTSRVFQTYPSSTGKIEYMNASSGCNNQSFFTRCERGADIDLGYNMTVFDASKVGFQIRAPLENGSMRTVESWSMQDNEVWTLDLNMPDLNTSKYQTETVFQFNASVGEDQLITRRNVTYENYELSDASENSVKTTQEFKMRFSVERPFTGEPLQRDRLNSVNVTIQDPNGDVFRNYSLSQLNYYESSGFYGKDVYIPRDAENGTYRLNVTTWDVYNATKSFEQPFEVGSIGSTFNTTDEIVLPLMDLLPHDRGFKITNHKSKDLELNISYEGGISNITTFNSGGEITVNASDTETFNVTFDPDEIEDYEGSIMLTDEASNYDAEIDVELYAPSCEIVEGRLCVDTNRWVNATASERNEIVKSFEVRDPRKGNVSVSINELSDEASFFSVKPASFVLNETQKVNVSFDPQSPGNFTGEFEIVTDNNRVALWTGLESNVQPMQSSMSLPNSLDLGAVTQGNNVTRTLRITNTGDIQIFSTSVKSPVYNVSIENSSIAPGETAPLDIEFTNVNEGSGQVTVTARTSRETLRRTIGVSTTLESGFIEENPSINRTSSESTQNSTSQPTQNPQGSLNDSSRNSASSGGGMIVPIAVGVFVLLLTGFIFYTSYIPEEGDPLYSVLGE